MSHCVCRVLILQLDDLKAERQYKENTRKVAELRSEENREFSRRVRAEFEELDLCIAKKEVRHCSTLERALRMLTARRSD